MSKWGNVIQKIIGLDYVTEKAAGLQLHTPPKPPRGFPTECHVRVSRTVESSECLHDPKLLSNVGTWIKHPVLTVKPHCLSVDISQCRIAV